MAPRQKSFSVERFFQALGDITRLRLLNLIGDQEICVCYLVEILGGPQPKISRHLAYLRSAGLVAARREGKWMHYRVVVPPHAGAAQVLTQTLRWLGDEKAMQADSKRLEKACCLPARYPGLEVHRRPQQRVTPAPMRAESVKREQLQRSANGTLTSAATLFYAPTGSSTFTLTGVNQL